MRIGPIISYYGSKWRAAPQYPPPQYNLIIEPFAGGAGYALNYPERDVVLVEKYAKLAEMWRWLIQATPGDIRDLPLIGPDDNLKDLELPAGAKTLMGFWLNVAGTHPRNAMTSYAVQRHKGGIANVWGEKCRERIANSVSSIKHWQVICGDYTKAPDVQATWYIDPPYQVAGRHYTESSTKIDYDHLSQWCEARRGQVMVCEAQGSTWLPFEDFRSWKSNPGNKAAKSHEVLYYVSDKAEEEPPSLF